MLRKDNLEEGKRGAKGILKNKFRINAEEIEDILSDPSREYAVEKLGESYTTDESATILRAYLKAGREGKKEFTEDEYKIIQSVAIAETLLLRLQKRLLRYIEIQLVVEKLNTWFISVGIEEII